MIPTFMPVNNSLAVDIRAVEEEVGEDVVAVVDVVIIMRVVVEEAGRSDYHGGGGRGGYRGGRGGRGGFQPY